MQQMFGVFPVPVCKTTAVKFDCKNKDAAVADGSSGAGGMDHMGGDDDKLRLPLHFHLAIIIIIIRSFGPGLTSSLLTDKSRVFIRGGG